MTQPILLTGGTGFIGSHTAVALAEAGLPVAQKALVAQAHVMQHLKLLVSVVSLFSRPTSLWVMKMCAGFLKNPVIALRGSSG